jgi:hypothetical protein
MKTFVFSYKRVIQITVVANSEPEARQQLQSKIDQAVAMDICVPHSSQLYEVLSAY